LTAAIQSNLNFQVDLLSLLVITEVDDALHAETFLTIDFKGMWLMEACSDELVQDELILQDVVTRLKFEQSNVLLLRGGNNVLVLLPASPCT